MGSSIFMNETVIEFGWSVFDTDILYFLWNGGNTTREHSPLDRITHRFSSGVVQKTLENVWEGFKNLAYSTVLCQSHTGTTVVDAFCS